ncbi:MAG TPA: hypothetical protein VFS24_17850, partial [Steroidobacteraceae bacterium]|nr:hypothetical protein [Steroidobacteraceae bacterium]
SCAVCICAIRGGQKLNAKLRGDVQEPDLRCDTPGTSRHVTTKFSICAWGVFYPAGLPSVVNPACLQREFRVLPREICAVFKEWTGF